MWHGAATGMAAAWAEVSTRLCVKGYHVYKDVWAAAIGKELVCHIERRNVHNFNPTKCATISNCGMNVDGKAEVDHILAQDDILYSCQMHLQSCWELLGLPQPTYYNMCRRDGTPRGKQRQSLDHRELLPRVPSFSPLFENFRWAKI